MTSSVLLLGSAPDAIRASEFDLTQFDALVVINNAWRIRDDWTHLIYPDDFPKEKRCPAGLGQTHVTSSDYVPANNFFGGIIYAGGTMAFSAAYWMVHKFKPDILAILGCDMVYDQPATHFYGSGEPDPLRDDPTLQSLEAKSTRLTLLAAQQDCLCLNLSNQPVSQQVMQRETVNGISSIDGSALKQRLMKFSAPEIKRTTQYALDEERKLNAYAETGNYWQAENPPDYKQLSRIDDLWLEALKAMRNNR